MIEEGEREASRRWSTDFFLSSPPVSVSMTKLVVEATAVASLNCDVSMLFSRPKTSSSSASRFRPMTARLLFVIGVKTSPGFTTQIVAHDHALLNRTGPEAGVFEKRAVERLGGGEVDVVADQIHQLEGAHAEVPRRLHDSIDGFYRGIPVAENAQRFIVKWSRDTIDDEAWRVLGARRSLAHGAHQRCSVFNGRRAGAIALNHFDQSHQRRRIEEMQAKNSFLVLRRGADGRNAERRGVAREQCIRLADGIQLLEDVALQFELLGSGFDDQTASFAILKLGGRAETVEDLLFLFRGQFAAVAAASGKTLHPVKAGIDEFLLDVVDERLKTGLSGDLGDARAHRARAEDGDFFGLVSHRKLDAVSSLKSRVSSSSQKTRDS